MSSHDVIGGLNQLRPIDNKGLLIEPQNYHVFKYLKFSNILWYWKKNRTKNVKALNMMTLSDDGNLAIYIDTFWQHLGPVGEFEKHTTQ